MTDGKRGSVRMDVYDLEARFNVTEFLDMMDLEEKLRLAESIGVNERVIDVAAEVLVGERDGWWSTGHDKQPYEAARLKVLSKADATLFTLAKEMASARDAANAECQRLSNWAWALWHAWPEYARNSRPEHPPFVEYLGALQDEDVRAIMADTWAARMAKLEADRAAMSPEVAAAAETVTGIEMPSPDDYEPRTSARGPGETSAHDESWVDKFNEEQRGE